MSTLSWSSLHQGVNLIADIGLSVTERCMTTVGEIYAVFRVYMRSAERGTVTGVPDWSASKILDRLSWNPWLVDDAGAGS